MVDPNRKINRLSDEDAVFLQECDEEFRDRFTMSDEEFAGIFYAEARPPPTVEPWQAPRRQNQNFGRGGGGGGNQHWRNNRNNRDGQHNNYRSQNQYQGGYNNRPSYERRRDGGGDGERRYRPHNQRPY